MRRHLQTLTIITLIALMGCKASKKASQTKAKKDQDLPIAHLGQIPVYTSEFKYVYDKNNRNKEDAYTASSLREYLDLFLQFKLKVIDAQSKGIDTTKLFKTELSGYEYQLAKPYLFDQEVNDKLLKDTYERLKEEVSASHILILSRPDAEPKDSLNAYQQILAIRDSLKKGASFGKLAKIYSQDPSAVSNKGYLGYFTALQMLYPFEEVAYNTSKGKVSDIFRTQYGYHILKVHDRRPSKGKVKVAHIMIQTPKGMTRTDSIAAYQKIKAIHQKLQKGAKWDLMCQQFSEDINSKKQNGQIPPFSVGRQIKSFEDAAFALQKPGQYSQPIKTPYGWHILKLIKKIELEPFDKLKPLLQQKVNKDSRSQVGRKALLEKLRKENNQEINSKTLEEVLAHADTSLLSGHWKYSKSPLAIKTILSFENPKVATKGQIPALHFMEYVSRKQKPRKDIKDPKHYMKTLFNDFVDEANIQFEKEHLADKYEDYRLLANEYREGMMLFQMMNENVWGKGIKDTLGARKYYGKHKDSYQWGNRVSATIFDAASPQVIKKVKALKNNTKWTDPSFKMPNIFFAKNSIELPSNALQNLNNLVNYALQDKKTIIEVGGYIDPKENPTVSMNRIKTITNYLVKRGLSPYQIIQKDHGKYKPLSRTDRAKNSRASLTLYSKNIQTIAKIINQSNPLNLKISKGDFQKGGDNKIINNIIWKKGEQQIQRNGRTYLVIIDDIKQSRTKTFEEAKGNVIKDYQKFLENKWLEDLKSKYPINIHEEVLQSLTK